MSYGDIEPLANACDSPIFLIKGFDDLREAEAFLLANTRGDLGLHPRPAVSGSSSGAQNNHPRADLLPPARVVHQVGSPDTSGMTHPSSALVSYTSTVIPGDPSVTVSPNSLVREALAVPLPGDSAPSPVLCPTPSQQTPSATSRGLNLPGSPCALLSQLETLTLTFKVPPS